MKYYIYGPKASCREVVGVDSRCTIRRTVTSQTQIQLQSPYPRYVNRKSGNLVAVEFSCIDTQS